MATNGDLNLAIDKNAVCALVFHARVAASTFAPAPLTRPSLLKSPHTVHLLVRCRVRPSRRAYRQG